MEVTKKTVATKYKQGNGWIVSSYNTHYKSWELSEELTYWGACARVKSTRERWNTINQEYDNEYPV